MEIILTLQVGVGQLGDGIEVFGRQSGHGADLGARDPRVGLREVLLQRLGVREADEGPLLAGLRFFLPPGLLVLVLFRYFFFDFLFEFFNQRHGQTLIADSRTFDSLGATPDGFPPVLQLHLLVLLQTLQVDLLCDLGLLQYLLLGQLPLNLLLLLQLQPLPPGLGVPLFENLDRLRGLESSGGSGSQPSSVVHGHLHLGLGWSGGRLRLGSLLLLGFFVGFGLNTLIPLGREMLEHQQ